MKQSSPFDYRNAVVDSTELTMPEVAVALTLDRFRNWETKQLFPSNEVIAQGAGCSVRTVITAKNGLIKKGWLISKRNYDKSNNYELVIPSASAAPSASPSLPIRSTFTSLVQELPTNIEDNIEETNNISSEAAKVSEVVNQEELPFDNVVNISKYLDSNLSLSEIKEEVNDKDTFFLIVKERKAVGIF